MNQRYPALSPKDAESVGEKALTGQFGIRCFFGIHRWAYYGYPLYSPRPISLRTVCSRCGWLKDIHLLS